MLKCPGTATESRESPGPSPLLMPILFGLPGPGELWIILLILLLVFGGSKLPSLARSMGSSVTQFKKGLKDDQDLLDDPEKESNKDGAGQ